MISCKAALSDCRIGSMSPYLVEQGGRNMEHLGRKTSGNYREYFAQGVGKNAKCEGKLTKKKLRECKARIREPKREGWFPI